MWTNKNSFLLNKTYIDDFKNIKIEDDKINTEGFCAVKSLLRMFIHIKLNDAKYFIKKYPMVVDATNLLNYSCNSKSLSDFYECINSKKYKKAINYSEATLKKLHELDNKFQIKKTNCYSYFMNDYHRIVSSSAFRRMQDKTQLFLMCDEDYSRTRLTHSIEVSSIAEKIAVISRIHYYIQKKNRRRAEYDYYYDCIDSMNVAKCSGVLHDIGNPPYGHSGEQSINNFFKQKNIKRQLKKLSRKEFNDLKTFDGNAQSLRIATKLLSFDNKKGASLSAAVLASIIKYPYYLKRKTNKRGFYLSEKDIINDLSHLGVYKYNQRNPFAFILETADDISYLISDLEDLIHKRLVTYEDLNKKSVYSKDKKVEEFIQKLDTFFKINSANYINRDEAFEKSIKPLLFQYRENMIFSFKNSKIGNNYLMKYLVEEKSKFNLKMIDYNEYKNLYNFLKEIKENQFKKTREINENEIKGDVIINYLLKEFFESLKDAKLQNHVLLNSKKVFNNVKKNKLISLISDNLLNNFYDECKLGKQSLLYHKMRLLIDFISGMTDSFAKKLYLKLKAIE